MRKQSVSRRSIVLAAIALTVGTAAPLRAAEVPELEARPAGPAFEKLSPVKAPPPGPLLLQPGDRLAICGDSITEQCMYSRLIEDYLTVCVPELRVQARQFGWSGETAEGFLGRMKSDCLRFKPTVATLCYGMNDYRYRPYDEANAKWYRERYTSVVRTFKDAGARVVLGSPGSVGKVASWVRSASGTLEEHNQHLCILRNIDIEIAAREKVRFADVFWPLYTAGVAGRARYGQGYAINGNDGVHPGWAGQLVMAYAFLKALGLDGDLGTIRVDLRANQATATGGHTVDRFANGEVALTSKRYPFCTPGEPEKDSTTRSGASLVPFFRDLSRLTLVVANAPAANYRVTWGKTSRTYSAAALAGGINLAEEFPDNPFLEAFQKVDEAIGRKEAYEKRQVKELFHSVEMQADPEGLFRVTEAVHDTLVAGVAQAFVPVKHTLKIEPQP